MEMALRNTVNARQGKTLLMEGASGTGKTRLLAEAIDMATSNGFSVVKGTLDVPGSENRLVLSLLLTQLSRQSISENGCRAMAVASPVKEVTTWLLGVLKHGPVLVVLDDLDGADASTLLALCDLIANLDTCPIVWIMALRPERDSISYGPMETHLTRLRAERIPELGPLSSGAVTQLVADCLGAVPDPAIVALAEGVGNMPGAVIELVHGLVQDGDLRIVDGTVHLRFASAAGISVAARALEVPRRFAAIVHRSLRSLSPFTKKALKLAAVLGTSFTPKDLSRMLDE